MSDLSVKICGLSRPEHVSAAVEAGATYIGFVFFPKSPRNVTLKKARSLALDVPPGVAKVALVVDPHDAFLDELIETVPLDMLQLHGRETPERVTQIKDRYGLPVMKAVGVADASDLASLDAYVRVADQILVDTKAPKDADRPGGNGQTFDWRLISGRRWPVPWMLAGGLTRDNVAQAVAATGARQIDLSSAVETAPGQKDSALIRDFMAAAHAVS
ncbi:N-(5'-phosphoribosyl)anthranilate isomerase [Tateyamaria omphalii]|uniref:phosphoribosylanthranilate isomerase n=1 Tax=Tateyamaria omphalii TaxID=299262 RepID=UPI00167AD5CB|nr:phosphoribosylanthranilate isomerase [Tateyamaria omphalii]GGX51576.1 N-(5'-phosphoribosyl)anthranilate isomerase [Tateyamaria omphalii]